VGSFRATQSTFGRVNTKAPPFTASPRVSCITLSVVTESSPRLISILRAALERLGDETTGGSSDPAVVNFKQRILRSLAQLELSRSSLKAPDVLLPTDVSPPFPSGPPPPEGQRNSKQSQGGPDQPPATQTPLSSDTVVVLVARRSRKSGGDDGGHSSAA
jgi:hypothetical protein